MSAADTPRLPATFNRLAWSNLAAQSAEQIALAAAPIVAVLLLGVGEGQTGALQTALTLPFILFAIPAGLLADRMSRRFLMAGAEALRAAALAAILLLIWAGAINLPLLARLNPDRQLPAIGSSIHLTYRPNAARVFDAAGRRVEVAAPVRSGRVLEQAVG